jgi:hypothetical protein
MDEPVGFIQNSISRTFVEQANELMKAGMEQKEIYELLEWNKSSMSSVMNGRRDVPIAIWERFQEVYKNANRALMPSLESKEQFVQAATVKMLFNEVAKIKSKVFSLDYQECVTELEQNTISILRDMIREKG